MSAGWNAKHEQRRVAERLWQGGVAAKTIALMVGVSKCTITNWRWEYQWPSRRAYSKRQINEPKTFEQYQEPTGVDLPTCFVCHGRASTWDGHDQCRGRRKAA